MSVPSETNVTSNRESSAHAGDAAFALIAWDRDGRVLRWEGRAEGMFGWAAIEAIGRNTIEVAPSHADDLERVTEFLHDVFASHRSRAVLKCRNLSRDGRLVWCEWHTSLVLDSYGVRASALALVLDVTDRISAEHALLWGETRLRQVLRGAGMLGWDWDFAARRVFATADLGDYFGLPRDRDYTVGDAAWLPIHPDDRPAVRAAMDHSARTGSDFKFEFRGAVADGDGRERWFSSRGRTLLDAAGNPTRVVAVTTDITERIRAEQEQVALGHQLLDAQKWESLGVLAGGIAHDFNNILTVVLGSAGLALRQLPQGSPATPYLEQIELAAQRAAGLCREMLAYAGRSPATGGATDLARVIRESRGPLEVSTTRLARVRHDVAAGLPTVRAEADEVRRVLGNLLMNAGEAVGEGGEVVVRAAPVEVTGEDSAESFRLAPAPGVYVLMSVSDNGPGITPEAMSRLFDPFFTTKFPGRGLGLSAVLGIVKSRGGGIRVDSAAGRGTTIEVFWPPVEPVVTRSVRPPVPVRDLETTRVALVVDAELYVREVAASTLEEAGYAALLAGDGPSALEVFRANRAVVRVVVSDVMMRGMTGDELLAAIRAEAPDTPAVLTSGYSDRQPSARGPRTEFLQKPFRPEELAAAVSRVVSSAARPA
jgi:PAS domain S-box-containing protein